MTGGHSSRQEAQFVHETPSGRYRLFSTVTDATPALTGGPLIR
jgi:hypothetical protein